MGYPNEMGRDVDIMGIQRGAHVDGEDVCPGYVFRVPGGELPDGTKVFGWNDTGAVYCARCGLRDTAHVVLKDLPAAAELLKEMQKKAPLPPPPRVAQPPPPRAFATAAPQEDGAAFAAQSPLMLYELEPGTADPLAATAYAGAKREHDAKVRARIEAQKSEEARIAAEAAAAARALSPAGGLDGETARLRAENERFKAEVEAMIKQSQAAPPTVAKVEALNAPPPEGAPADVAEMLTRLNLPQYVDKFEEEGMEMGVLIALARGDGKDALDDALKEAGVKSVGHRLKIFAALQ